MITMRCSCATTVSRRAVRTRRAARATTNRSASTATRAWSSRSTFIRETTCWSTRPRPSAGDPIARHAIARRRSVSDATSDPDLARAVTRSSTAAIPISSSTHPGGRPRAVARTCTLQRHAAMSARARRVIARMTASSATAHNLGAAGSRRILPDGVAAFAAACSIAEIVACACAATSQRTSSDVIGRSRAAMLKRCRAHRSH
jgi:hypothetical protein